MKWQLSPCVQPAGEWKFLQASVRKLIGFVLLFINKFWLYIGMRGAIHIVGGNGVTDAIGGAAAAAAGAGGL